MKQILTLVIAFTLFSCIQKIEKSQASRTVAAYDKIRLISYNTARIDRDGKLPAIVDNDINISGVEFVDDVTLTPTQSEKIIEVLQAKESECVMADCYNPRHILLFYKQAKLVGFYEFCAECGGSMQSENLKLQSICTAQGDELIQIFKEMKLRNDGEESEDYKYF